MEDAFLANTSTEGLTPLGTAPQRSFELITATVEARLSPAHAAIFSEPVATEYGDRFDWYSTQGTKPRALDTLEPEAQEEIKARLEKLMGEIADDAATLSESDSADDQRLGEALANALQHPEEGSVYVVEGPDGPQPVLVNWAWVAEGQTAVVGKLSGAGGRTRAAQAAAAATAAAAAPAMAAAAAPAPPPPGRDAKGPLNLWWLLWLGWLLLMLMIGAILYLMVSACALNVPGLPNHCPPPGPSVSELERDAMILRDRIAAVERDIGIARRMCQPEPIEQAEVAPPPPLPPLPTPEPEPQRDEFDNRMDQAGAQLGDLTFTLIWNSTADLDLHVTCPTGGRTSYQRRSNCNGRLDVDSNAGRGTTSTPVENIFYNGPRGGEYSIRVNLYAPRQGNTHPFKLRITDRRQGTSRTLDGTVSTSRRNWTTQYQSGG